MSEQRAKRIAVVGVGAVGGVFAAHLSAVHEVVSCVRRPFNEYVVESSELPFIGPATVATNTTELPWSSQADAVFVGLKSQHTDGAAEWFEALCGPETLIVVMQNGIEAEDRFAPHSNGAAVVPSVVYCGAELVAPGRIKHDSKAQLIVANDDAGHRAAALVEETQLRIDPSETYLTAAWVKLGINSAANGLTALTGRPMNVMSDPGIARIAEALLTECWTVGRVAGADLDIDGIPKLIRQMSKAPGGRTSMLHDREAGRPTEHDAIHGAVIRQGIEHKVETPTTIMIHDMIAAGA